MRAYKKIIMIVLLGLFQNTMAQNEDENKNEKTTNSENHFIKSIENFSLNYFQGGNFGNNFINKAHDFNYGIAGELHLKVYKMFYLGAGLNQSGYEVVNKELVGNYARLNHTSMYASTTANFEISNHVSICPQLGLGITYLRHKKEGTKIENQNGIQLRVGAKAVYSVSREFGFMIGLHYVYNAFQVKTNPGIEDFYNQSHSINFGLGIILF